MKKSFEATGADFIAHLIDNRVAGEASFLPHFPEHMITEVYPDPKNLSRIHLLGEKVCQATVHDYVVASFETTDKPLNLSFLAIGEVDLGE